MVGCCLRYCVIIKAISVALLLSAGLGLALSEYGQWRSRDGDILVRGIKTRGSRAEGTLLGSDVSEINYI